MYTLYNHQSLKEVHKLRGMRIKKYFLKKRKDIQLKLFFFLFLFLVFLDFSDILSVCGFTCLSLGQQIQEHCPKLAGISNLHNREFRAFYVQVQSEHKCTHLSPFLPLPRAQQSQECLALKLLSSKAVKELRSQKMKDFFS